MLGAAVLLGITFPFLMVLGLAVLMSSSGPVLLVQERLGRYGRTFRLLKFRTLRHSVEDPGPLLTGTNDPRQTRVGRWLRESKLDELPQLWNVLRGDMSLVGPRPHLPQLWDNALAGAAEVLSIRPGLTSLAALEFYREHEQLEAAEEDSIERFYLAELLPQKIHRNLDYAARASFRTDMAVLVSTLTYSTIHLFTVLRRILRIGHSPLPMQ